MYEYSYVRFPPSENPKYIIVVVVVVVLLQLPPRDKHSRNIVIIVGEIGEGRKKKKGFFLC